MSRAACSACSRSKTLSTPLHPVVGIVLLALVIGSLLAIAYLIVSFLRDEGIARPRL